jgi:hypothetical protein
MKPKLLWTCLSALLVCALTTTPALAQHDAGPDAETGTEAGAKAGTEAGTEADTGAESDADAGTAEPPIEAASDAKRIVRIRQVIVSDNQHLRWLRSELRSRTEWHEGLAAEMGDIAAERNEKKEKLEALDADPESDSEEVDALRNELQELDQDYGLFDTQTDLALSAERAVREQIEALESKIAKEERAIGELTGEIEIELPEAATAKPAEAGKEALPVPLPLPLPIPAAQPPPQKETKSSSTMSAAQIEAHQELEQEEREVQLAKVALSEFVERKRALEEQIEFEEGLAETDAKELENMERALKAFEARLQKYRETGAPPEKIQRLERGNRRMRGAIEDSHEGRDARAGYIGERRRKGARGREGAPAHLLAREPGSPPERRALG